MNSKSTITLKRKISKCYAYILRIKTYFLNKTHKAYTHKKENQIYNSLPQIKATEGKMYQKDTKEEIQQKKSIAKIERAHKCRKTESASEG